mmetsp:Transcript_1185/g.3676  ORF Transcript_1185/g.3676 Transcript_1185/m.3676 type:complete len:206 (-) Transcript_1185:246-863(-)
MQVFRGRLHNSCRLWSSPYLLLFFFHLYTAGSFVQGSLALTLCFGPFLMSCFSSSMLFPSRVSLSERCILSPSSRYSAAFLRSNFSTERASLPLISAHSRSVERSRLKVLDRSSRGTCRCFAASKLCCSPSLSTKMVCLLLDATASVAPRKWRLDLRRSDLAWSTAALWYTYPMSLPDASSLSSGVRSATPSLVFFPATPLIIPK